jgi:acetyl esterase/lipase
MIDAVRAARHLALVLGVPASTSWAATGHSQGVGAAIGAAQLATTYGKGLRLRATVGFAPGSGVAHALTSIYTDPNWYPYLGYMAWGMKAIDTHHQFTFADLLGPWILPHINGARHLYFDYWWQLLQSAHWSGSYPNGTPLTPTVADVLAPGWQNNPVVKRWLRDRTIGLRRAVRPVLVVQGTADTLYPNFPELKAQLKHAGDRVKYVLLAGRDHDQAVPYGWPAAKAFLERYLFGR